VEDATRRTRLAAERTQLAWWRTGLTAIAVGIGIGRILPALDEGADELPYVVLGCAFAVYGMALFAVGITRGSRLDQAVSEGRFAPVSHRAERLLAAAGVLLGLAVIALIALR
jgi:putative membrane protein